VPSPLIRIADLADGPAVAALRRAWTAEDHGKSPDEDYEARFLDWYERESGHRINWLAELAAQPVGMMNLLIFERMPRPGLDTGTWGYLANAFVLAAHRNQGIGTVLLTAVIDYADEHGYLRIVLRPTEDAIPFYLRAGFFPDGGFLVRPAPGS
jgi:GNAT superfamily N-acetyltransferase